VAVDLEEFHQGKKRGSRQEDRNPNSLRKRSWQKPAKKETERYEWSQVGEDIGESQRLIRENLRCT
jgi:hypothetical protein